MYGYLCRQSFVSVSDLFTNTVPHVADLISSDSSDAVVQSPMNRRVRQYSEQKVTGHTGQVIYLTPLCYAEALVYCFMELLCGDLPWRFDRDVATAKPVEFEIFAKKCALCTLYLRILMTLWSVWVPSLLK